MRRNVGVQKLRHMANKVHWEQERGRIERLKQAISNVEVFLSEVRVLRDQVPPAARAVFDHRVRVIEHDACLAWEELEQRERALFADEVLTDIAALETAEK